MTLVYANIAISWQFLRLNSLKKHFPQIYRFKRFENGWEKKFPDLKFFPLILAKKPLFFPDFPDWKKSSKFSLISLIGGNPLTMMKHFILSLGGAVVTRSPLIATAWVQLQAACGMSFTLHSQCLVENPSGFSSTLRRAQNCSIWNLLIRPTGLARTCSGWRKINGFTYCS